MHSAPRVLAVLALLVWSVSLLLTPATRADDNAPAPKAAVPAEAHPAKAAEAKPAEAKTAKTPAAKGAPCGESSLPQILRLQFAANQDAAACIAKDKAGLAKALIFDQRCVVGSYVVVLCFFALFFAWVERRPMSALESAILVFTIVAALADGLENVRTMAFAHGAADAEAVAAMACTSMAKWCALGLAVVLAGASLVQRDWLYHRAAAAMVLAGVAMAGSPLVPWAGLQPWVAGLGVLAFAGGLGLAAANALRGK